jgi:hypothetical protein
MTPWETHSSFEVYIYMQHNDITTIEPSWAIGYIEIW